MKRSKIVRFLVASVLVLSLATILSGCSPDDFDPTAEGQEAVTFINEEETTSEGETANKEIGDSLGIEDITPEISVEEQLQMFKQQQMLRMSQIHRRCMQPIPRLYNGRIIH